MSDENQTEEKPTRIILKPTSREKDGTTTFDLSNIDLQNIDLSHLCLRLTYEKKPSIKDKAKKLLFLKK